ncbi:peptidoglycan DD-metalloendopeptidase family protein [Lysobacter sp. A378]
MALQCLLPDHTLASLPTPLPLDEAPYLAAWSSGLGSTTRIDEGVRTANTWLELLMLMAYLVGAAASALRWARGTAAVKRIVQNSRSFDRSRVGALTNLEAQRLDDCGINLLMTEDRVSPFALCWPRSTIIIPVALTQRLSDAQLQMVLRHEAAHISARDPKRAAILRAVGVLFWFNPFLPRIVHRIQMAAELCCDASAVAGDTHGRRAYAEAYLSTLRISASSLIPVSVAFSAWDPALHKLRISHMIQGDPRGGPRLLMRVLLGGLALTAGGVLATTHLGAADLRRTNGTSIGTAFVTSNTRTEDARASAVEAAFSRTVPALPQQRTFRFPLARPEITGAFGEMGSARARAHRGLDFRGRRGTPVHAPAAGTVVAATALYGGSPNYGTVVVLDHGDGWQSLYAHLDGFDVSVGDRVSIGDRLGRVGTTGKVTGAHLHMELLLNGQRVDPQPLLVSG